MQNKSNNHFCGFCDKEAEKVQEITRTKCMRVIYPRKPVIKEHLMILPVRHVERVENLNEAETIGLLKIIKRINKCFAKLFKISGFNIIVNSGKKAGQSIPHVHFHFFGRSEKEKISPFKILNNPELYKRRELSKKEIKNRIDKIRKILIKS